MAPTSYVRRRPRRPEGCLEASGGAEEAPELRGEAPVLADHGFAGAAIQAGVETLSVADVNDPALIVAKAQGRTEVVVVLDDHVPPEAYWPCFQAVAARFS